MGQFKVNFKSNRNKYIELGDNFESNGALFNAVYKGKMPLQMFQKLRLTLMKNITDPMGIDSGVLQDALNEFFNISVMEKDARDFEISDAVILLNSFISYVDEQRVNNKKK